MNKYAIGPVCGAIVLALGILYLVFRPAPAPLASQLKSQMELDVNTDLQTHVETITIYERARQRFNRLVVNYVDKDGTGKILDLHFCGVGPFDPPCPKSAASSSSSKK